MYPMDDCDHMGGQCRRSHGDHMGIICDHMGIILIMRGLYVGSHGVSKISWRQT